LAFVYRSGDGDPEPQEIEWRNVETRFSAKTNQPWVVVTPSEGSKLTRLRVQVIPKDLPVGTRTAEIVVTPSRGALVTVPVRLEIIDSRIEADTKPGSPPPVALRVRPERLDFNHRLGTAGRPFSQTIVILQGAVANVQVTPSRESRWLRHSREGAGIRVEVMPEELGEGAYQAVLVLSGTDPSLSARVAVNLRVDPPVAVPRPKSAETPPGGPGCAAGPLYAATEGAFTWNGELAPGSAVVVNYNGVSSGGGWLSGNTPPDRFALEVKVLAGNVEVSSPSSANGCAPLRIANRGAAPVTSFRLQWKIVPAENRY
jgi:hypothetical protein